MSRYLFMEVVLRSNYVWIGYVAIGLGLRVPPPPPAGKFNIEFRKRLDNYYALFCPGVDSCPHADACVCIPR